MQFCRQDQFNLRFRLHIVRQPLILVTLKIALETT